MTEIATDHGRLYLATVIDLYSRRLHGAATGLHPDAELACDAIKMAVAARGGKAAICRDDEIQRVILHTDRGSTYTATSFMKLCRKTGIRQSMGRVGSCFDNAAAEAFFSSLEWEVLSRHQFVDTRQAQAVVLEWCYGFYNHTPSAQQRWHDGTHHLRDDRPHPRSGQKRNPPRFGVKLTSEARSVTNIAQVIQRGGTF